MLTSFSSTSYRLPPSTTCHRRPSQCSVNALEPLPGMSRPTAHASLSDNESTLFKPRSTDGRCRGELIGVVVGWVCWGAGVRRTSLSGVFHGVPRVAQRSLLGGQVARVAGGSLTRSNSAVQAALPGPGLREVQG